MYYYFLQSQLNPHFLFNTLKNIFWKTVRLTGSQNEASRMIDLLTTLLYYALVQPDKFVMISEEIKMTNCYLEIQQLRFDSKFKVTWKCGPEIQSMKIIKFILQLLVENIVSPFSYTHLDVYKRQRLDDYRRRADCGNHCVLNRSRVLTSHWRGIWRADGSDTDFGRNC